MTKKKYLSILLLLLFLMVLSLSSKSYCFSADLETINEYVEQTTNYYNTTYYNFIKNHFNRPTFQNILQELDFETYDTFIIESMGQDYIAIGRIKTNENTTLTINGSFTFSNVTSSNSIRYYYNNGSYRVYESSTSNANLLSSWNSFTSSASGTTMILTDIQPTIRGNYIYVGKQAYCYINCLTEEINLTDNEENYCYVADYRIGTSLLNNYDIEIYYLENGSPIYYEGGLETIATEVEQGEVYILRINRNNIVNGQTYYFNILSNNNVIASDSCILYYNNGEIEIIPGGTITNASGEVTGNIDLSNIENGINNINNILEEQQETNNLLLGQESGEKAETFWDNVYNNLFTMESGEVQEIIDNFVENTNLEELGTLEVEEQILNILNDEPGDFIISWNDIIIPNLKNNNPTTMIPSGQINFSSMQITLGQEVHQFGGEHMTQVITAFRVILGYTICILMIANIWETVTRTLGVGVNMYEANEEEKQRLAEYDYEEYNINEEGKGTYMKGHYNPRTRQRFRMYREIK